jgi:hypothetical protein
MNHTEVVEWLLIAIFLFIILWILFRRQKEGFGSGYGFAYRRQKIDATLPYLVANEPSLYLRNTDGQNNYELRLDANGLVIYNNDVSFIAIDNVKPDATQRALLYTKDKSYVYADCIQVKGSTTADLSSYDIRDYGSVYYFKNLGAPLPVFPQSDLYLTSDGNLVATNDPMTWANGMAVIVKPSSDIANGQFMTDGTGNYFEYIRRDNLYVFEHYKLQRELIKINTIDISSSYTPNLIGVSNETIYITDISSGIWKWANGYDVSNTLGSELRVGGWMSDGISYLQLKKDGLYLNGSTHIKFKSEFATSMKLENGNLIVRDNAKSTIWNLNTGPGNANKLVIDDGELYLQKDDTTKWTIYPDASYNYSTDDNLKNYKAAKANLKAIETNHSGSDERYANAVSYYYREMINTLNLGVGLLVGTIVIFRST